MSCVNAIGSFAYVPSHVNFFKNQGRYYARGSHTPAKGDVIFFRDACHIGLVEYSYGGYVHTIEGNTSGGSGLESNGGGVFRKVYPLSSSYIMGYGVPCYTDGDAARIIAVAISQLGYLEKKSNSNLESFSGNAGYNNWTKFGAWYQNGALNGQPWCDMFVSWCAYAADQNTTGGPTASATTDENEVFDTMKTYKNGSTDEPVYADTALKIRTGSLNPYESCDCLGIVDGRPLVKYLVDGTSYHKTGFVEWTGGVRD